jgi:hypothetical protein
MVYACKDPAICATNRSESRQRTVQDEVVLRDLLRRRTVFELVNHASTSDDTTSHTSSAVSLSSCVETAGMRSEKRSWTGWVKPEESGGG